MPNSISVSDLYNNTTWKKELTFEEVQAIRNFANGKKTVPILPAAFMPVRTNNCKNFTNDFFLPTLINQALKVKSIALKIFAFIFDFITFPFRFLFCLPRIIANAVRPENLFLKYLKNEGVEPSLINADSVRVQFEWESKEQHLKSRWTDKAGNIQEKYAPTRHWEEFNVNFIEVPNYKDFDFRKSGMAH